MTDLQRGTLGPYMFSLVKPPFPNGPSLIDIARSGKRKYLSDLAIVMGDKEFKTAYKTSSLNPIYLFRYYASQKVF
jgi:hypothetical protein